MTSDGSITFEKNPCFYNADQVSIKYLQFIPFNLIDTVYKAYNEDKLDFADTLPANVITALTESNDAELHIADKLGTNYIACNANSKLFEGKTPAQTACMRKAFSLLIDRDSLCRNSQTSETPASSFIPPGMADGNGSIFRADDEAGFFDVYAVNNDPEGTLAEVRELLEAAGYKFGDDGKLSADTPININYVLPSDSKYNASAEYVKNAFAAVGINTVIHAEKGEQFFDIRRKGDCDMSNDGWISDFNDPVNMLEMWTTSSGNNHCHFGGASDGGS